jgi:RNA polymerase sigma-70 factor (ECF subfamily)
MLVVARAYFASQEDAQDAVQEAFVEAFRALGKLRDGQSFAAWLTTITVRECLNILRTRTDKVSLEAYSSTAFLKPRLGQEQLTPATLASRTEEREVVMAALGLLPDSLRVVLMLRYAEHLSYDSIAGYLGVPASTVRGRLERAKQALCKALQERSAAARPMPQRRREEGHVTQRWH